MTGKRRWREDMKLSKHRDDFFVKAMTEQWWTQADLARHFRISPQRANQIYKRLVAQGRLPQDKQGG